MLFDNIQVLLGPGLVSFVAISGVCLSFCLFCTACLTIYRLFFHPLASIPGPRLAAASYWYEYYYDVVKEGKYMWKLIELHKEYGPVLRVNPNEVHISDPEFYQEIYHSKAYKTHRDTFYNLRHLGDGIAFTTDHDLHALRRHAINSYFSMQSIRQLEPRIVSVVQTMVQRLSEECKIGEIVNIYHVFAAFAMDIVSEYAFGEAGSTGMMSRPDYGAEWSNLTRAQIKNNPLLRQFPYMISLMKSFPTWVLLKLNPGFAGFIVWENRLVSEVKRVLQLEKLGEKEVSVIYDLAHSDLPPREKDPQRLKDEANLLLGAGAETTAQSLTRTAFRILDNPHVLQRLRSELKEAIPDAKVIPSLTTLHQLPYLTAVIEEGLRIAFPVLSRSPRVFQDHALHCHGHLIPPGSAVSQATYFVQSNPSVFPDPFEFKPERWLNNKALQKYQVTFSKGRRSCLGMNLAYAEMYFGLAMLFRRFDLELFETTVEDVVPQHDFFVSWQKLDSVGVRVKVDKELP